MVVQGEVETFGILSSLLSNSSQGWNQFHWPVTADPPTLLANQPTTGAGAPISYFKVSDVDQHKARQTRAEPENCRGDLKILVSWLLFGLHLISCYFVDSWILLCWSCVHISTIHKYFLLLSQILLLPGQLWPTLLLGHMGWWHMYILHLRKNSS